MQLYSISLSYPPDIAKEDQGSPALISSSSAVNRYFASAATTFRYASRSNLESIGSRITTGPQSISGLKASEIMFQIVTANGTGFTAVAPIAKCSPMTKVGTHHLRSPSCFVLACASWYIPPSPSLSNFACVHILC